MREERPPRLLPTLVVGGIVCIVALTVIGWVVGAVIAAVRAIVLLVVVVAAVWALLRFAGDR